MEVSKGTWQTSNQFGGNGIMKMMEATCRHVSVMYQQNKKIEQQNTFIKSSTSLLRLRIIVFVLTLLCIISLYAIAPNNTVALAAGDYPVYTDSESPILSDGLAGTGTETDIEAYWTKNGYPDYISYAYEAGGEIMADGESVSWWTIGIVKGQEDKIPEILSLMGTNTLTTFIEVEYSYKDREAVYEELCEQKDENIEEILPILNAEQVLVVMKKEVSEELVEEYREQFRVLYGDVVVVLSSNDLAEQELTGELAGDTMGQYYEEDLLDSALTSNTVNKNDEQRSEERRVGKEC